MNKPVLYFALLGRKASGKSCLFTALNAPREVNENHISICFAEETKQYKRVVNTLRKEAFLQKSDNLQHDKMGSILKENVEKIKNGELLDSTGLPEKYVYVFSLSAEDKFGTDIALLDYAGEILNNKGETNEYFNSLLKKMDGIFLLIGIPNTQKEEEDFNEEINKLTIAFNAIDVKRKDKSLLLNIPIVLLVSKFDRYIRKNNLDFNKPEVYGEHFKKSDIYQRLKPLIQTVANITEYDMFKVFLTSAFGECSDKDIPINRTLLRSINLLEPFDWAARKSAQLKTDECKKVLKNGFFGTLFKNSSYFKQAEELMPIFPSDSENYKILENINTTLGKQRSKRFMGVVGMLLMAYLGTDCYFDKSYLDELSISPKTEEECENRLIGLRKYLNDDAYRHVIAKLSFFSNDKAKDMIFAWKDSQHVIQIENLKNESDNKKVIAKCDELLKEDSTRSDAEIIKELKRNAELKLWDEIATLFENDLNRKLQVSEPVRLKDVGILANKIDELEKTLPESRKNKLDNLKAVFEIFDTENRRKSWIVAINETKNQIARANSTTDDLNEDDSKEIQENITNLQNTYKKSFDADGKLESQLQTLKQDYDKLVTTNKLKAWEKQVNSFESNLDNLAKNKTTIDEEKLKNLNSDLLNIRNTYRKEFNKSEIIEQLSKQLDKIHNDSKSREWNRELDDIQTDIKMYDNNSETPMKETDFETLDCRLNELKNTYEKTFGENSLTRLKETQNSLASVWLERQKKEWKASAAQLKVSIDACKEKDPKTGLDTINSLSVRLTKLETDLVKNPSWNFDKEFDVLKKNYDDTKSTININILDKDFSDKLREATNYANGENINDFPKAFELLIEAKKLASKETLPQENSNNYNTSWEEAFKNVLERVHENLSTSVGDCIKQEKYSEARSFINNVLKSASYLQIMKESKADESAKNMYEQLIQRVDKNEFINEFNNLSEICKQNYRDIFSLDNKTKINNFLDKYKDSSRSEFSNYIEEVKVLSDYIGKGEACLCAEIEFLYPESYYNSSDPEFAKNYKIVINGYSNDNNKIEFITRTPGSIHVYARCNGTYDNLCTSNNTKLKNEGSGDFDESGKCEIRLKCTNSNGDPDYDKDGTAKLKIISFKGVPQLSNISIEDK